MKKLKKADKTNSIFFKRRLEILKLEAEKRNQLAELSKGYNNTIKRDDYLTMKELRKLGKMSD